MELRNDIEIDAPAERVWQVLGERFMHVGEWAAPITSSCPVGPASPGPGATRSCEIAPFGPFKAGVVKERLTVFDPDRMTLAYEALEGMPRFVERAVNRWTVVPVGDLRARVHIRATLSLRGPIALFGCILKWQLEAGGARVAVELKHFVEHGRAHPRKRAAAVGRHVLPE